MPERSSLLVRAFVILIAAYAALGGTAYNPGILTIPYRVTSLFLIALIALLWLVSRTAGRWKWQHTALDLVIVLWLLSIGISTLANLDSWRRITLGLWFALFYIGVWYIMQDLIGNGALRPVTLLDGLLISGAVVLAIGYNHVFAVDWNGEMRIQSTLDNPNNLSAFIAMLAPLIIARFLSVRHVLARLLLALYLVGMLILLVFTFSRGGYLAIAASLLALGVLLLAHYELLSAARLRGLWQAQSAIGRLLILGGGLIVLTGAFGMAAYILISFSAPGRSIGLRTYLFEVALRMMAEQPIAGYGLFTYGRSLSRLVSTPPYQIHTGAHNGVLNIGAELGLIGLVVLFFTLLVIVRGIRKRLKSAPARSTERLLILGPAAGLVGFAAHHVFDITMLSPMIALTGVVLLSAVLPPPIAAQNRLNSGLRLALFTLVLIGLLVYGVWSTSVYSSYLEALDSVAYTDDPRRAAQMLQPVVEADPSFGAYRYVQAHFLGVAASRDPEQIRPAIAAYERYLALEPYQAFNWANLAALHWQAGERDTAIRYMSHAAELAPESWVIALNLGLYHEQAGNAEAALGAYRQALNMCPDCALYPLWQETILRRDAAAGAKALTETGQLVGLILEGKLTEAQALWAHNPQVYGDLTPVMDTILRLEAGDVEGARAQMNLVLRDPRNDEQGLWLHLGKAYLALKTGDRAAYGTEHEAINRLSVPNPYNDAAPAVVVYFYAQQLRMGIGAMFLPHIRHPQETPWFAALYAHLEQEASAR